MRVEGAWKTLEAAGLPMGAPRPSPSAIDFPAVRRALSELDPGALDDVRRTALAAWLEAWKRHWPSRFERELGETGEALRRKLRDGLQDENRYLKLRRIAVENLSSAL